jgi:hypothetical protein
MIQPQTEMWSNVEPTSTQRSQRMCCKQDGERSPQVFVEVTSPEEIRELKTQLLFRFLRDTFELNKQLRTYQIAEEILQIDRERDRAMHELLLKEGK